MEKSFIVRCDSPKEARLLARDLHRSGFNVVGCDDTVTKRLQSLQDYLLGFFDELMEFKNEMAIDTDEAAARLNSINVEDYNEEEENEHSKYQPTTTACEENPGSSHVDYIQRKEGKRNRRTRSHHGIRKPGNRNCNAPCR